jgi:hypothetical protein
MRFDAHANMSRRGLYHRQFHRLQLARRNRLNRSVCHTHLRFVSRLKRQSKSRTPLSWGLNSRRWWGDLLACRRRRALPIVRRRHISCCPEISVRPAIHPEKPRESNCRDQSSDSYVRRCRASKVCGKLLSLRSPLPSKRRELGSRNAGCGIRCSRRQSGQISSGSGSALNMRASQDFDLSSVRDR